VPGISPHGFIQFDQLIEKDALTEQLVYGHKNVNDTGK